MTDLKIDQLRDAIAGVAGEGCFVNRYVVVAEIVEPSGEVAVHSISDADLAYQTLGLLDHGRQVALQHFHEEDE